MNNLTRSITLLLAIATPGCIMGPTGYTVGYAIFGTIVTIINVGLNSSDYATAHSAYERGDYTTAFDGFLALAKQKKSDSKMAQYILGGMYHNGRGVERSYLESVKWYRRAAKQGVTDAQWALGIMHLYGEGVPQDYIIAKELWQEAAEHGSRDGALLARMALDIVFKQKKDLREEMGKLEERGELEEMDWYDRLILKRPRQIIIVS